MPLRLGSCTAATCVKRTTNKNIFIALIITPAPSTHSRRLSSLQTTSNSMSDSHVRQRTGGGDEEQQRRLLPVGVLAVAAMNNRSRLFIPGKENFFAGIRYEFVMIDNGCNSLLLPFPEPASQLEQFRDVLFSWSVSHSRRTAVP